MEHAINHFLGFKTILKWLFHKKSHKLQEKSLNKKSYFCVIMVVFIRLKFILYLKDVWNTPLTILLGLRFILNGCFIQNLTL